MVQVNTRCPLCNLPSQVTVTFKTPDVFQGHCERCGYIRVTGDAVEEARRLGKLHILSAWFRRMPSESDVLVKRLDVGTIIEDTPEYSVLEKLDYPMVYAASPDEAAYYINQLAELSYVKQDSGIALVSAKGFQRL